MGRRGPKPQPSALKRLRGNPGKRRLNEREPKPQSGLPRVPSWLRPEVRKHWKKIAPMLDDIGVMTVIDGIALALLCEALGDYIRARGIVERVADEGQPFLTTTDKGNVIQHPAVGVMNKAWERVLKMLREFGMTPSSRSGLETGKPDDVDPVSLLMARLMARFNERRGGNGK